MNITTIGIDLAKNTLSLHGVEWSGQAGVPQDLEPCEVAAVPGFTAAVPHRLWRPVPEPISLDPEKGTDLFSRIISISRDSEFHHSLCQLIS